MSIFDSLADARKEQFKQQDLKHVHNFRGKLTSRGTAQDLFLEGRDADENTEADAIFLPDQSIAQFQLNYVMIDGSGNPIDAESSIHLVEKTGSGNLAINNDSNYPNVIVEHSAGTATESADLSSTSGGDGLIISAQQDAASVVHVHATLELLAFISTDLHYLKFQSN